MEASYIIEIAISTVIILILVVLKVILRRKLRDMEGSLGFFKKKDAKGKVIGKNE